MAAEYASNVSAADAPVDSPQWWLARLYKSLAEKRPAYDFFDAYYTGDHPLPWLAPQARQEFRRLIEMTRSNYMGLVVDAMVERIHVEGFRLGGQQGADEATWDLWQANDMDSDSDLGFLEAGIAGCAYYIVEPNRYDPETPLIGVELGSQAVTESLPGQRKLRKAGLKLFTDDWTGLLNATLYWMDLSGTAPQLYVFKYEAEDPKGVTDSTRVPDFKPRAVTGEEWGGLVPEMDRLPLVPIENNPRLRSGGVSELYDLTDMQDRVNKTLADRLVTQDYGSFPQKWASAWPEEDDEGNPNKVDVGRNRMITTDVEQTKFGQFMPAELDPYSKAKREDVKDIASRSRTPAQYLLGEMSNVNGETLKASESGLVAKVRQRMRPYAEATEEAMRMARRLAGLTSSSADQTAERRMETIFGNPEYRTEGELTDAVIKRFQSGISSLRQSRRDVGYTETQIRDLEKDDTQAGVVGQVRDLLRQSQGQQPGQGFQQQQTADRGAAAPGG